MKEFGLKLHEIYELSPRQIAEVYFHPRDKDGAVVVPEPTTPIAPPSGPGRYQQLLEMIRGGLVKATAEQIAELQKRVSEG